MVTNVLGQRVRTVALGQLSAGRHDATWDGKHDDGSGAASGVYYYQLQVGSERYGTQKMLLAR